MKLIYSIMLFFLMGAVVSPLLAQQKAKQSNAVYLDEYRKGLWAPAAQDTAAFVVERKQQIEKVLKQPLPVQLLIDSNDQVMLAQQIALRDSNFIRYTVDKRNGRKPLLSQVFGVYPARPGDLKKDMVYLPGSVARVEMYNFAYNLSSVAIVDVFALKVLSVNHYPQAQPDLPAALVKLAVQIAVNAPEVEKALGFKPSVDQPVMSSTKTALNRTKCERSQHLCVAPTFIQGKRALWAVVDITDQRLVGLRWTNVGEDAPSIVVTEKKLQNENIADCYCEQVNKLNRDGWKMDYVLTSSDGLMISGVQYNGRDVMHSAKLVDWHVSYSNTDGFGYSDAVGCPIFSQSAVVATEPPQIFELVEADTTAGFVLEQKYYSELWPGPCNYSYAQRFLFYKDGRFRVTCASIGRGCGNDGTYRPVMRIVMAGEQQRFSEWQQNGWMPWRKERWQLQQPTTNYSPDGSQYKIERKDQTGYLIEPGKGQFGDGGRGDQAFVYVTKNHPEKDEGETDLITIGPCCNTDFRQGPEKFIDKVPENIYDTKLVIWYVPQMKNDDAPGKQYCWAETYLENGVYKVKAYPCFAGPLFKPITAK